MSSVLVTGAARRFVAPDRAVLGLGISVVAPDPALALDTVAERIERLGAVLDALGVPAADRTTDAVSVGEEREWRDGSNVLIGHRATSGVTVTIRDLDLVGRLLRAAVTDAAAEVRQLQWQVDAEHPARLELLGDAARDARRRGAAYAEALGLRLGAVELISERPIVPSPPDGPAPAVFRAMKAGGDLAGADGGDLGVDSGRIELRAQVDVRFGLLMA